MIYKNHAINPNYAKMTKRALLQLWANIIGKPYAERYLLSESAKIVKGEKFGYVTGVQYLPAAERVAGGHTCSHSELADCAGPCLIKSGHMALPEAVEARADRLKLFLKDPALWFEIFKRECATLKRRADSIGFNKAGRCNGTTDLDWTRILFEGRSVFEHIDGIQWYDYTKNPNLAQNYLRAGVSITFSWYKRADSKRVLELLDQGVNIAITYRDSVPEAQTILDRMVPVLDGDRHDLRFLDQRGHIVGLKYKFATMSKNAVEINRRALESGFIIKANDAIA